MRNGLQIVSVGMVTAVGLDAPSSCAAMRARLDGFRETDFDGAGQWLTGAPVPLPKNWIGEKRLAHLASAAIIEALDQLPEAREKATLILCVPEQDRPEGGFDARSLLSRVARIAEIDASQSSRLVAHGRASGHVAIRAAAEMLNAGEAEYVCVVGVDSYLNTSAINYGLRAKRLLTQHNPNGFIPGEAAAAFVCCRAGKGGLRLLGLGLAREPASIYNPSDLPLRGDGMTEAYSAALRQAGIEMKHVGYRIADLIGEQYWFKQTALANIRLLRDRHDFQDIWSPTESLGNVGAAVGPIMVGMAFVAAKKRYAAGNPVLIEASNENGACAAAVFAGEAA